MSFQDQTIVCIDCKKDFIFSAGEQEFFEQRGFTNIPKRCNDCRSQRKAQSGRGAREKKPSSSRGGGGRSQDARPKYPATCSRCSANFDAPFQPKPDRPIFCRSCFDASKG